MCFHIVSVSKTVVWRPQSAGDFIHAALKILICILHDQNLKRINSKHNPANLFFSFASFSRSPRQMTLSLLYFSILVKILPFKHTFCTTILTLLDMTSNIRIVAIFVNTLQIHKHIFVIYFLVNVAIPLCPCDLSAYKRNEYQEYLLSGKSGRRLGLTTLPPSCSSCLEILVVSISWSAKSLCRFVMGYIYLYLYLVYICLSHTYVTISYRVFLKVIMNVRP
jgi:hypothetical protein